METWPCSLAATATATSYSQAATYTPAPFLPHHAAWEPASKRARMVSCLSDRPLVQRASVQLTPLRPRRRRHLKFGGQRSLLLQLRWLPPQVRDRTCKHRRALKTLFERAIARRALGFQAMVAMTTIKTAATGERRRRPEALLAAPPQVRDRTGNRRRTLHTPLEQASAVLAQHA